ncbi:MAG: hypothetical protein HY823_03315 [Acidobacteria bacterium]|nr:hypothetical protein [Acidobacteriota bacterium]
MGSIPRGQRGEGKVGCIASLIVFLLVGAAAAKLVPYWWDVDQLASTADELASRAGTIAPAGQDARETIKAQLLSKAREQNLPEAAKAGAITISIQQGADFGGMCTIRLNFSRNIDFYGITSYTWTTDKTISKPWGRY